MKAMHEENFWSINPFYGASMEYVKENFKYAKEVYKKIFQNFVSSYVISKELELGIIRNGSLEELEKNNNEILKAIEKE